MSLRAQAAPAARHIEVAEPLADRCGAMPPPEGHIKLRNYRLVGNGLRVYTPTGDVNTSPSKGKLVSHWEFPTDVSLPRNKILELVLPEQPGSNALEAIVRPACRRGFAHPLDDDARRISKRTLSSSSPLGSTATPTLEPELGASFLRSDRFEYLHEITGPSLADELRQAEEETKYGHLAYSNASKERKGSEFTCDAMERERLGRLALSVEQDDSEDDAPEDAGGSALSAAARHLDTLLAESRDLHEELAEIHRDMQTQEARAGRCAAAARALGEESRTLRFLDDVVALLRGDFKGAVRVRGWPFAFGGRLPERNYII